MAKPSVATASVKTRKPAPVVTVAAATNVKPAKVKVAPAPAPAPVAEAKAPRAPRAPAERLDITKKIKVLAKENPKRPGSKAHAMWEKYRNGMTVAEARQAGVSAADINWNVDKGFISLA